MPRRVFITAAEASGDQHAAELIRHLRQLDPAIQVEGLGGAKMAAAGATLLEETVGRAAMGWRGALRAVEASRWLKRTAERYRDPATRPDLHVCVDSSAVNLPFARLAKQKFGVPVLYYVAPQLWASREGRIKKVRQYVDHLACIFPFEQEYFRSRGVKATFVGHPLFDQLPPAADRARARPPGPRFPDAPPVVGIIPGSRRGEVRANLPHLMEVMDRVRRQFPQVSFLVPTTAASDALVRQTLGPAGANGSVTVQQDGFNDLVPRCDLVITKSGTSTVHVAAWNVPMIVVYRVNPLLWHGVARWLVKTRKIAMVNILAGQTDLVPEFIPWYGSNQPVADCAIDLLKHPEKLAEQRAKLTKLMRLLDRPGASMNAAKLAVELMEERQRTDSASPPTPPLALPSAPPVT
ncbi:MAG TPA: lipid-A-disaccharide synthase [Tepidisphaeraceae bacterium]|nr:lipid-A-disaccharide synthase [Tepidisphaeraceae bacterium]